MYGCDPMIKGIIFDWNRTLYDKDKKELIESALFVINELHRRKYKMCIVSKGREHTSELLRKHNLSKYFSEVVLSEEKTEKEFVACLNEMRLRHDVVLVVGDRIKGEIKLGNSLGMKTVWFRNGKYADETPSEEIEKPTHIITALRDLLKLI